MRAGTALGIALVMGLAGCAGPEITPLLAPAQCRQLTLVDADTGAVVRGAEDLALDPATGMVYVAATDRWAVEAGARRGAAALPQGAIYAVPLAELATAGRITVTNAARAFTSAGAFHPQGIDLLRADGEAWLAVVNRRYRRSGPSLPPAWGPEPAVELFALTPTGLVHRRTLTHPTLCRPNDVAWLSATRLAVTNDHGCDAWPDWLEDVLGLAHADVVGLEIDGPERLSAEVLVRGIAFANGVTATANGVLYVAVTRAEALQIYRWSAAEPGRAAPAGTITLPGGPDNLTPSVDGRLLAAVHPALLDLGLYRHRRLGRARAPSRVVAVDPASGDTTVYLDDPDGAVIAAATVALAHDGWLVLGSVTDAGLALCPDPGSARTDQGRLELPTIGPRSLTSP